MLYESVQPVITFPGRFCHGSITTGGDRSTSGAREDHSTLTHEVVEHRFTCPYCWQSITMLLDLSAVEQSYVEDCEVCCNPISLRFRADAGEVVEFDAGQLP